MVLSASCNLPPSSFKGLADLVVEMAGVFGRPLTFVQWVPAARRESFLLVGRSFLEAQQELD
jgi:hypothetical protein